VPQDGRLVVLAPNARLGHRVLASGPCGRPVRHRPPWGRRFRPGVGAGRQGQGRRQAIGARG